MGQPDAAQPGAADGTDNDGIFEGLLGDATAGAQQEASAIQAQYDAIFRELKKMYNLSETEEEKERLRFLLADIEAQRDAGLQAIAKGYGETVAKIRERAATTRTETAERSERYGQDLSRYAQETEQRMIDQQAAQVAANRGLGIGSGVDPMNEWVGLMNTYPAAQRQYTQRMGDITAEGIDSMADLTASQSQAQQADLQRLAAATRSSGIMSHQNQVAKRIQQEQAEMRAAMLQLSMAGVAASQRQQSNLEGATLREYLASLGNAGYSDAAVQNYLQPLLGRALRPDEMAVARYERARIPMTQVPQAAGVPAGR
jgi:hypothetical protein